MKDSGRRHNSVPLVFVLAGVLTVAFGIHFAQAYTGDLETRGPVRLDYGQASFSTSGETYPRSAVDAEGHTVTIAGPPQRLASLEWAIDDFTYAVAPPEKVIAVSSSAYERRISNVFELAEKYQPVVVSNPEILFKLSPDLAIDTSGRRADFADILRQGGVPIFGTFTLFTRLDEVARTILLVGYLTGRDEAARRVFDDFQGTVRRAEASKPAGTPAPRILGFAGRYTYGDQTLFNDIVRAVGGVNVAAEHGLRGYDAVNTEQILRWNPDWIVAGADRGQSDQVLRRLLDEPAIAMTAAARKGQIIVFDHHVFLAMSPFTTLILDGLSQRLYSRQPGN